MKTRLVLIIFLFSYLSVFSQVKDTIFKYENFNTCFEITDIIKHNNNKYINIFDESIKILTDNDSVKKNPNTKNKKVSHIYLHDNDIWCVTTTGLFFKLNNQKNIYNYVSNKKNSYLIRSTGNYNVSNILFPANGFLGIVKVCLKNNTLEIFEDSHESSPKVTSIYVDKNGVIWVGTLHGIYTLSIEGEKTNFYLENSKKAPKGRVYKIVGNDDFIYVGGEGRIWKYDINKGEWVFLVDNAGKSITLNIQRKILKRMRRVEAMTLDEAGNLWIASNILVRYNVNGRWDIFEYFDKKNNRTLKKEIIATSICTEKSKDNNSNVDNTIVWIGTKKNGLWRLKTKTITTTSDLKNIVFVIDPSLSKLKLRKIKRTIKLWAAYLNPTDIISVVSYVDKEYKVLSENEAQDIRKTLVSISKIKKVGKELVIPIKLDTISEKRKIKNGARVKRPKSLTKIKNNKIFTETFEDIYVGDTLKTKVIDIDTTTNAILEAYSVAEKNYKKNGNNRIIVFTNGVITFKGFDKFIKNKYDNNLISIDFIIY